ncbi:MAG: hypothetical protein ACI33P_04620 [Lysinibacillus sp.]
MSEIKTKTKRETTISKGISFGSALAIAISWSVHKSIIWACIHGLFSWLYVIYYAFTR